MESILLKLRFARWAATLHLVLFILVSNAAVLSEEDPFRPETGKFPPLEKAHSYRENSFS